MKNIRLIMLVLMTGFLVISSMGVTVYGSPDLSSSNNDSADASGGIESSSQDENNAGDSPPIDNDDAGGVPSGSDGGDSGSSGSGFESDGQNIVNNDNQPAFHDTTGVTPVGNDPPIADAGGPYHGHVGEEIKFDGSGSWDPDGNIVGYKWDFDGGGWDTGWLPTPFAYHTYTVADDYTVKLKVKDDGDENGNDIKYDTDTTTAYITVNQNPVAIIDPDYVQAFPGEEINFYGGDSYDDDGSIVNYKWYIQEDYDWELIKEGENEKYLNKTFNAINTYYIKLEVVDDDGASGFAYASVLIHNGEDPLAVIDLVEEAEIGETVTFNGSGSWDPDGTIEQWDWTFGCGSTDSGEIVYHTYQNVGSYHVTLTVTDDYGNTHTSQKRINISEEDDDSAGGTLYTSGSQGADDILLNKDTTYLPSSSTEILNGVSSTTSSFLKVKILERISQTLSKMSVGSMFLGSIIASKIEILSDGGSSPTNPLVYNFTIGISYTPWPCHENEEITFTCNIYGDPTGPLEYFWDFENDGTWEAYTSPAVHTYTEIGTYTVFLKVRDTYNDETATTSTTIIVEEADVSLNISSYTGASTAVVAMSTSTLSGNLGL